jgi:hypothetical protein
MRSDASAARVGYVTVRTPFEVEQRNRAEQLSTIKPLGTVIWTTTLSAAEGPAFETLKARGLTAVAMSDKLVVTDEIERSA